MKVLHVGKYFPPRYGGIETFMSQLMEEQADQGLEVAALVHADKLQSSNGEYAWKGCKIFEVKCFGQLIFAPVAPGYPYRIIHALRSFRPDIVHVHMPNLSAFWLLVVKRFFARQAEIVIHWHADVLGSAPTKLIKLFYPVYKLFETQLLKNADKVISTSPPYLKTSIPLKPFAEKCVVIPLGIKIKHFDVHSKKFSENRSIRLCMIGRLVYYKAHSVVLKALAQLQEQKVSVTLDVIGDGELALPLQKECSELGIQNCVFWHGSVSEQQKDEILKSSDVLLLPSLERTEAFGVVLLEAANYAVPAIVSNVNGSGMSYVIENNVNGKVVDASDADALASAVAEFIKPGRTTECGKHAYNKLNKQFDIAAVAIEIQKLYKGLQNAS
ncbi:glycosyltransferase [Planctobacterium marinum]